MKKIKGKFKHVESGNEYEGVLEPIDNSPWKPEKGEYYFLVDAGVDRPAFIQRCVYEGDQVDKLRQLQGNVFQTKKEAKDHLKGLKFIAKVRKWLRKQNGGDENWMDWGRQSSVEIFLTDQGR